MAAYLRTDRREHKSSWITLARPEKHNAFDETLIAELIAALTEAGNDDASASVVLAAEGASFSAGADLDWMRRAAQHSRDANVADARELARLMRTLDTLKKPTIAVVQGAAYGGALGLIACCDVAIAATNAKFCFSEARLGLIPAVISPYVVAAIGARQARRYFQSAEVFDAETARSIGLVHELCEADQLSTRTNALTKAFSQAAPNAKSAAKQLIRDVAGREIGPALDEFTANAIADARAGNEAREGLAAFFEKRKPSWQ
jgi:methylglutaconyl-CoA hydratase